MKTKKNHKKNHSTRNYSAYTPGRNVFGEKAETHLIVLKRGTALQQILDCISQFNGSTKEFTFNTRCFNGHEDELEPLMKTVNAILALKAQMGHNPHCAETIGKIA